MHINCLELEPQSIRMHSRYRHGVGRRRHQMLTNLVSRGKFNTALNSCILNVTGKLVSKHLKMESPMTGHSPEYICDQLNYTSRGLRPEG